MRRVIVIIKAASLVSDVIDVDLRVQRAVMKEFPRLQNFTVFRDEVVPGKHHIGARFAVPAVGIDVSRDDFRRMGRNETAAVFRLADRFVAAGKVDDDVRPR